jgi:hypothetical protein
MPKRRSVIPYYTKRLQRAAKTFKAPKSVTKPPDGKSAADGASKAEAGTTLAVESRNLTGG